jgi:hypothetical protein
MVWCLSSKKIYLDLMGLVSMTPHRVILRRSKAQATTQKRPQLEEILEDKLL